MEMTEGDLEALHQKLTLKKQQGTLDSNQDMLLLATGFALDLVDGDLNDYFFNETGNHVKALLEALKELNAGEVHDLVKEALDQLSFTLPEDAVARQAFMTGIDQDILITWDALTEDYYDLEQEFWQLLGGCA